MITKNKISKVAIFSYLPAVMIFAVLKMLVLFDMINVSKVGSYLINAGIQIVVILLIPFVCFGLGLHEKPKSQLSFYGYRKTTRQVVGVSFLMGVIVYILTIFTSSFWQSFLGLFGYSSSSSGVSDSYPFWLLLINLLTTAVLPAICEETLHRGMLAKGLSPLGSKKAILISGLLFGLLHLNINQVFYATLIGFLLGYIAIVCNNIYPAIIIHFTNNALSVLMEFSSCNNLGFDFFFTWLNKSLTNTPIIALLYIIVLVIALCMFIKFLVELLFTLSNQKRSDLLKEEMLRQRTRYEYYSDSGIEIDEEKEALEASERFSEYRKKLGYKSQLDNVIYKISFEKFRLDKSSKIVLIWCFTLTILITLCTFIWGIL